MEHPLSAEPEQSQSDPATGADGKISVLAKTAFSAMTSFL
jgi:hypothetical protein